MTQQEPPVQLTAGIPYSLPGLFIKNENFRELALFFFPKA